jgi:hypothetical protein
MTATFGSTLVAHFGSFFMFCGRDDQHPCELFLEMNEIEHARTKAQHPQTNGICERFHQRLRC